MRYMAKCPEFLQLGARTRYVRKRNLDETCEETIRPGSDRTFADLPLDRLDAAAIYATIAAENGATEHMLMSIYGWESPKQAALYTRKARRARLAQAGMQYLDLGDLEGIEDLDIDEAEDET
jgi:hypothetical protein